MKCCWCDTQNPDLYAQCSGISLSMQCCKCGTNVEDWDWKRLNTELRELRYENKLLKDKLNGTYII